jgi:four helix bundle protein
MPREREFGFRSLIAWKEAKALAVKVYRLTAKFPKEELFGITSQMRRAASSITSNIAEGSAMPTKAHRIAFYVRARGSTVEVDNFAELAFDLQYLTREEFDDLVDHCARVSHLITRLIAGTR